MQNDSSLRISASMGVVELDENICCLVNTRELSEERSAKKMVGVVRKAVILFLRNRKTISVVAYAVALFTLALLAYDPTYIDTVFYAIGSAIEVNHDDSFQDGNEADGVQRLISDRETTTTTTAAPVSIRKLFDLPFVPRDFHCDEMHNKAGRNFTYPEGYMDHADAYKSALQLNDLLEEASSNEQSWILQELAQLPFVRLVCETGFNAGHNAFHILTANYDVIVNSFERLRRFNYTLEMTDFMIIEFPDRFNVYDGDPRESLRKFVADKNNTCDISLIDSSQPRQVVRDYLSLFRSAAATRRDNLVVMNAHPGNVVKSPYGAEAEWEAMKQAGQIVEHFRCRHTVRDLTANQMGMLVGSFVV